VPPEASALIRSSGSIDAAYAAQYTCDVLVEDTSLPSTLEVVNVQVQVIDVFTQNVLIEFSVPTSASLSPSTRFGTASVVLVDAATLQMLTQKVIDTGLRQEVMARFTLEARTPGGSLVAAPTIDFPIAISVTGSCVAPAGQFCWGPQAKPASDCALGIDEPT